MLAGVLRFAFLVAYVLGGVACLLGIALILGFS